MMGFIKRWRRKKQEQEWEKFFDEVAAIANGTHPMFNREMVLGSIRRLEEGAKRHGIETKGKPIKQLREEVQAADSYCSYNGFLPRGMWKK